MDSNRTQAAKTRFVDGGRQILLEHLVDAFSSLKRMAAGIVALCLAAGVAVALFFPFTMRATVTLVPLSDFDTYEYRDHNLASFLAIDSGLLQGLFLDAVREGELVRNAILTNKIVERDSGESDAAFELRVERAMAKFGLIPPAPEAIRVGNRNWTMHYGTRHPIVGYQFLRDVISTANKTAHQRLITRYEQAEADYVRARSFREADLRLRRRNMIADYDRNIESQLAVLDERVALLKATGSKQGQLLAQSEQYSPGQQIAVVDTNKLAFVPGYEEIERHAALIRSRENKENFVTGLIGVDQEIRTIEQDQSVVRGRAAFERVLLKRDSFKAVNTDLTRASFQASMMRFLAVLAALGIGIGLAGLLIVGRAYRFSRGRVPA